MTREHVALTAIFAFCMTMLIGLAHAEDARCDTLRALRSQASAFPKEQVARAVAWYNSNCGRRAVRAAAR